ncbi:MAG: peptidyl-prolyl cis-trans isomerase [Rhodobacteraceae bacterium]|nr:peptidyl-prolyl cis-trans isomerase [Paracoccaceae bacterium]
MADRPKKKANLVVWLVLGLLVFALGGFGIGNFGGTVRAIGSVGSTEIPVQEYMLALQGELRARQAQSGRPIPLASPEGAAVAQEVQRQLVGAAALENETARLGLSVGDEAVRAEVIATPAFQGLDGKFDRAAYADVIRRSGLSEADFEENIRTDAATGLVRAAVVAGIEPPVTLVERSAAFAGERRDILWLRLDAAALPEPLAAPTEAELEATYEADPAAYTLPERKRITYVALTPESLVDEVTVDEAEVRRLYEERSADFNVPERRLVERLVFPDAAAAEAARARLDKGEASFDDLVAERGLALIDVDLGDVSEEDLGAAGPPVFALEAAGVAGPIETPLGPALFRVNAVLPAQVTPFEEVRDDLAGEIAVDRARRQIDSLREGIEDLLAAGNTLETVAEQTAMELGTIEFGPDTADGIAGYEAFREKAAAATAETLPELFQLEDGGVAALRVDAVLPPALQPLEDVRERVIADWQRAETEARLTALAEELKAARGQGRSWEELGRQPEARTGLARDSFLEGAPEGLVADAFGLPQGGIAIRAGEDGSVHLVEVTAIIPQDPESEEAATLRESIGTAAAQGIAQDALNRFIAALEAEAGISLNQSAINAAHAQFP